MTRVQSILVSRRLGRTRARDIQRQVGGSRLESTRGGYFHIPLYDPAYLRRQGFRRFRLKTVKPGIKLIVAAKGPKPNPSRMFVRSKKMFRSARAAWEDIGRQTGLSPRDVVHIGHTRTHWRWATR